VRDNKVKSMFASFHVFGSRLHIAASGITGNQVSSVPK
jgi:hypothetical protein